MNLIGTDVQMKRKLLLILVGIIIIGLSSAAYLYRAVLIPLLPNNNSDIAAWVGAIGSISAVFVAIWVMHRQHVSSEELALAERAYAAQNEKNEKIERTLICLMVSAQTAAGIISALDVLEKANEEDLPWTLDNQAKFIARCSEPTLRIPMHELGSIELVQLVFGITGLAQRLADSIDSWRRYTNNPSSYVSDLRQTIGLLKPEADTLFASIKLAIGNFGKE